MNKWQDILVLDMQQVPELEGLEGSNWWSVDLSFDEARCPSTLHWQHAHTSLGRLCQSQLALSLALAPRAHESGAAALILSLNPKS